MAITTRINGTLKTRYIFRKDGYMYTVGPRSGVGKLNQPGTRGLVIDDTHLSARRPGFKMTRAPSSFMGNYVVGDHANGYYAVCADNTKEIHYQTQAPSQETFGLETSIKNTYALPYLWLFPKPITNFNYAWDSSRYGNKPAGLNNINYWNDSGLRCLQNSEAIYKWEAHVVVSCATSFLRDAIAAVYIPYLRGGASTWQYARLTSIYEGSATTSNSYYKYFMVEVRTNLPANSAVLYPVIVINGSNSGFTTTNTFVQTKFCFKAD